MKNVLLWAALFVSPLSTLAAEPPASAASASAADTMTEGEVRKVDLAAGKVTLRHGEIKPLDMPAMTMVFQARDKRLLEELKPGDKVRFQAAHEGGVFLVTDIQPIR